MTEQKILKKIERNDGYVWFNCEEQEVIKKALEKQVPYKPQEYEDRYYACECGNILLPKWAKYPDKLMPKSEGLPHCMACGRKLDWSEEDD